jgi:hypothetical protein
VTSEKTGISETCVEERIGSVLQDELKRGK